MDAKIKHADVGSLFLDPKNPRLGREEVAKGLGQDSILELMRDWTLDELAVSFVESGFWEQEALIVVKDRVKGHGEVLVVVEGNRRLAALKNLQKAALGEDVSPRWKTIAASLNPDSEIFKRIPYIVADNRDEVAAFLGFRHVTGIKEWRPAEKAEFIAHLLEKEKLNYVQVAQRIGSKGPTVRQNYIAFKLLLQLEDCDEVAIKKVENKFSVLYLSLRTQGVQDYLALNIKAEPQEAKRPARAAEQRLINYSRWLFGDEKVPALFTDSRHIDQFGQILQSKNAVNYLERTESPNFDVALHYAGGDEPELIKQIEKAADCLQFALTKVHHYKKSKMLIEVSEKFSKDVREYYRHFPTIWNSLVDERD